MQMTECRPSVLDRIQYTQKLNKLEALLLKVAEDARQIAEQSVHDKSIGRVLDKGMKSELLKAGICAACNGDRLCQAHHILWNENYRKAKRLACTTLHDATQELTVQDDRCNSTNTALNNYVIGKLWNLCLKFRQKFAEIFHRPVDSKHANIVDTITNLAKQCRRLSGACKDVVMEEDAPTAADEPTEIHSRYHAAAPSSSEHSSEMMDSSEGVSAMEGSSEDSSTDDDTLDDATEDHVQSHRLGRHKPVIGDDDAVLLDDVNEENEKSYRERLIERLTASSTTPEVAAFALIQCAGDRIVQDLNMAAKNYKMVQIVLMRKSDELNQLQRAINTHLDSGQEFPAALLNKLEAFSQSVNDFHIFHASSRPRFEDSPLAQLTTRVKIYMIEVGILQDAGKKGRLVEAIRDSLNRPARTFDDDTLQAAVRLLSKGPKHTIGDKRLIRKQMQWGTTVDSMRQSLERLLKLERRIRDEEKLFKRNVANMYEQIVSLAQGP